uniref:Cytokine receptor-like factor 2 n=1 Tax=Molossus molossus TaxID=27622 RepID=A0A7J8J5H3_MOLMO|nr:cytokine receptor like factor 2 [Molossus molossus]
MSRAVPAWAAAVLLLGQFIAAEGNGAGAPLQHRIINFNFETVQVTWNASQDSGTNLTLLYRFRGDNDSRCPDYILQRGRSVGCLLPAKGDRVLDFSIWNGTQSLLSRSLWISDYLKPSSPRDLRFRWHQEAITVTCTTLSYTNVLYEVQHKSTFDREWQSKEEEDRCNVTIEGLDVDKCYLLRARVIADDSIYGPETYPSDWSEVTYWQGGELQDSCQEKTLFSKHILVYGMVTFLIMFLLLLCLWKLHRVKKLLLPRVPDPKVTFPGLFETHQGNFQEWIGVTQGVSQATRTEDGEQDGSVEEALLVLLPKAEENTARTATPGPSHLPEVQREAVGGPGPLPDQPPQGELLSLGGVTFVMSENSYVTL